MRLSLINCTKLPTRVKTLEAFGLAHLINFHETIPIKFATLFLSNETIGPPESP